jgi:hypothetical protein
VLKCDCFEAILPYLVELKATLFDHQCSFRCYLLFKLGVVIRGQVRLNQLRRRSTDRQFEPGAEVLVVEDGGSPSGEVASVVEHVA